MSPTISERHLSANWLVAGDIVLGGLFGAAAAAATATAAAGDHVRQFPEPQHAHKEAGAPAGGGQGSVFGEWCVIVCVPLEDIQETGQLLLLLLQKTKGVARGPELAGLRAHHQLGEEEEARAHRAPEGQDDVAPPDPGPLLGGVEGRFHGDDDTRRVRLPKLYVVPGSSLRLDVSSAVISFADVQCTCSRNIESI